MTHCRPDKRRHHKPGQITAYIDALSHHNIGHGPKGQAHSHLADGCVRRKKISLTAEVHTRLSARDMTQQVPCPIRLTGKYGGRPKRTGLKYKRQPTQGQRCNQAAAKAISSCA